MEDVNSVWQIGIFALVAGAMIGVLAHRLLAPSLKQADKVKTELDEAREELDSYKTSVNQHFNKTSELVNDLAQNYVKFYQHLAEGAQTLGDSNSFASRLEQNQGRVSIAVDDKTDVPDKIADDLIVDSVVAAAAVGTLDEHAEPFSVVNTGDPVNPEDETTTTEAVKSSDNSGDPAENMEPVLNVEALEEASENANIETRTEADSAVSGDEEKIEARPTTH